MNKSYIQVIKQLDKFASAFSGIGTLDKLVESVEEILEDIFDVEHTGLYLYVPSEDRLRLLYAKGFSEKEFQEAEQTAIERHPGMVYRSKQMIHIPDTWLDDKKITTSAKRSFEIRSRLYLPVMNGEEAVGTFGIVDTKPYAFHDEDIAILSFICNMAGVLYGKILNQKLLETANEQIVNLSKITTESPNPILQISRDNKLLFANKASHPLLNYHGFKVGETVSIDFLTALSELSASGKPVEREITDGIALYSFIFSMVEGTSNFNLFGQDITKRKMLENKLTKMALIAKKTGNSVILSDKSGKIEWVNDAFLQLSGYSFEEVKGRIPAEILEGEDTDKKVSDQILNAIKKEEYIEVDILNYSKTNKKYWIKLQIQPVFNPEGELEYFISIQKEITSEKARELELIRTTTLQKAILNSSAIAIISTDLSGVIQSFNPAASQMLGYDSGEVIGLKTPHLFHDETELKNRSLETPGTDPKNFRIFKISDDPKPDDIMTEAGEFTFVRKDGSKFPVSLTVSALRNKYQQVTGFLAMAEDITQRREQYEALQIANLRFRMLISSMQAGIMVEDAYRKVVLVNQRFCDLFSIPAQPEQLIGMDCKIAAEASKALFSDPENFIREIDSTIVLQSVVINHELMMKDGTFLERDFVPIENPGGKNYGILWIYRNITQRKNYERDLLRQSEILNGTALAMNYLLTLPNHDQAIQRAIEAIGTVTGTDRVYIFENREDKLTGASYFSQRFEWTKEGIIPQIDNPELQDLPFSEGYPRWYKLLKAGQIVTGMVKDFPEDERQILESQDIISLMVVPIFAQNRLWGMVGFDDCTKAIQWTLNESSILKALAASIGGRISRKIIENELIEARQTAEYATKSKSEFLATMSHEIRTPMNGVIGMTSLLMQTTLSGDQREYAETIKISGELLLDLINDILDFSKIESGSMILEENNFDLRMAIEDVLDLMATTAYNKNLGLYFQVDARIPQMIKGDLTRLRQILVNLTGNAIKFTSRGEVVIRVKQIELTGNEASLEFSVKDTGIGIPPDKTDMLFKPFSQVDTSTTRKFGGTGLGLAISSKLVALMKGEIWVQTEPGRGSEFLFTIKTMYQQGHAHAGGTIANQKITKGKKIMVIDGNPVSNEIICSLSKNLEMDTVSAGSAKKALSLVAEKRDFDIILVDNDLPDIEVKNLASQLKTFKGASQPHLILISHPELSDEGLANSPGFHIRIKKPLKHSQLVSGIEKLLASKAKSQRPTIHQPRIMPKINEKYPLNILVAEDNAINQKLILSLFQMLGYSIQIAANGFEAIETLNRMKIDIIFMDVQMPEMDGLEATRHIIAQWNDKRPLIVAMTANALISDKEKCLENGMDDYISKPLTIDQVKTGIEKWAPMCKEQRNLI